MNRGLILDAIEEPVLLVDDEGVVDLANEAAAGLFGRCPHELAGRPLSELVPGLDGEGRTSAEIPREDGPPLPVEVSSRPLRGERGDETRVVSLRAGGTGQPAATRYLRASRRVAAELTSLLDLDRVLHTVAEALRTDFDAVLARIWLRDPGTGLLHRRASAGVRSATVESLDEYLRTGDYPFEVGQVLAGRRPFLQSGLRGDSRFDQGWVTREDVGSVAAFPLSVGEELCGVLVHFSREPLSEEFVEVLGALSATVTLSVNDVRLFDREREARREAEEARSRYRSLVDDVDAIVWETRPEERGFSFVSRRAEELLGYPARRWLSEPGFWESIQPPGEARPGSDGRGEYEHRLIARDGREVWFRTSESVFRDAEGRELGRRGMMVDITERRQAERALKRSEERYRTFVERSSEGIWREEFAVPMPLDLPEDEQIAHAMRHLTLAECNDAMARQYGYDRGEELEGTPVRELIPRTPENVESMRLFARSGFEMSDLELQEFDRYGNVRYFSLDLVGVFEGGYVTEFWGTQRDITERKLAEEALQRSESRFRRLFEQAADSIFVHDLEGAILDANREACRSLGYTREELLGMSIPQIEMSYEPGAFGRMWERMVPGEPLLLSGAHRCKDGAEFPVEVRVGLFDSGDSGLFIALARDVTERRRQEERLRHSEERFRSLVQHSSDVITVVDAGGVTRYQSPAVERVLGYPADLSGGDPFALSMMHPDDVPRLQELIDEILRTPGAVRPVEMRVRHRDGSYRHIEGTVSNLLHEEAIGGIVGNYRDVTARKEAEESLRVSETRFRTMFEQSPLSIQIFSADGRCLEVNGTWERLWGAPREAVLGWNILRDEQMRLTEAMPYVEKGFSGEVAETPEIPYHPQRSGLEGRERFVRGYIYPVKDEAGSIQEVVLVHEDVTERRRAEEALREAEENYRGIFENAAEGIFRTTPEGRFLVANPMMARIFGYDSPGELMALRDVGSQLYADPGDREEVLRLLRRDGAVSGHETRMLRKNGTAIWVSLHARVGSVPDGSAVYEGIAEDITERKRAEEEARQGRERYQAVIEQMLEGIFLFDAGTRRLVESNTAFGRLLGYSPEECIGMEIYDFIAHDREGIDSNVRLTLEAGHQFIGEREYRRKDGSVVEVEVSGSVILYGGRETVCAVLRDITERRRMEEALREVRQAERQRIARDLHDDALQDIVYASQEVEITRTLSGEPGTPARLEGVTGSLRRAVSGLREAIYNLRLDGTRGGSLRRSLESLVELHSRLSPERSTELQVDGDIDPALSEEGRVELVRTLQETLANVRKHSGASSVWLHVSLHGEEIRAEVSDDGAGFDPETVRWGAGVTGMHERVSGLGGELGVHSAPGRGTRVCIRVPARPDGG